MYTDSTNAQPSQVPWGTPAVQQSARRFCGAASWRRLGFRAACYALSSGGPLVGGVVEPPWTEGAPHDAGGQTLIVVVIECTTATGATPRALDPTQLSPSTPPASSLPPCAVAGAWNTPARVAVFIFPHCRRLGYIRWALQPPYVRGGGADGQLATLPRPAHVSQRSERSVFHPGGDDG